MRLVFKTKKGNNFLKFKKNGSSDNAKKVSRKENKKAKQRREKAKKRRLAFHGQKGFVSEKGYVEFDGYIHEYNGRYVAVYDVLVKYGTHNPESYGWLTKLIPSHFLRNGDIYFAHREKGMGKKEESAIFSGKLSSRRTTMIMEGASKDVRETSRKEMELKDIDLAQSLSKNQNIVDSDVSLVIWSDTPEGIEQTVKDLKQNYKDQGINGIFLVRKTFKQMEELFNMFHTISADAWHNSDMTSVAAARMFYPSSGFADERGTLVGMDLHSFLPDNITLIDFQNTRHAVIATGGIPVDISINGLEGASLVKNAGSAWAHVVAEDNYLVAGTRTHHINLVPFGYHAKNSVVFDMQKYTINSLEVYGTKETVEQDANDNFEKVVEIIMMLLEDEERDSDILGMLKSTLWDWIVYTANNGNLYTNDPQGNPRKAQQILATTNHETYPTLGDFVASLMSLESKSATIGELAQLKAHRLKEALETASRQFPSVFRSKTNIPDSLTYDQRNIYYDLSTLTNNVMIKGSIFLNVLAYVTNRAATGDMIVIHGLDSIKINPNILKKYRRKMDEKGIGLITTFEDSNNDEMNVKTLSDFVGRLTTQDIVILGAITPKSKENIEYAWSRKLPRIVADDLSENAENRFYIYRKRDLTSAVVNAHLIL